MSVARAGQDPEAERANATRVTHGDHCVLGHEEERIRAFDAGERVQDAVFDRHLVRLGDEMDEDLGVGRRLEDRPLALELGAEIVGVRKVAVVADRERAARIIDSERLRVLQMRATGGGVAHVADRHAAGELREVLFAEDVLNEAHRSMGVELRAVARDDAGRLLPAMLQRVQAEIREVRRLGVTENAEDAAHDEEDVARPEAGR